MPGPPAPFVPTPLPNIGQSGKQPDGYSTSVTVEGDPVAIRGASFGSSGDIASKGTGGGMVSNNAEGPTKFIAPGSTNVQIEGKNVQYLGDQMQNNCGPGGSPANAATLAGVLQPLATVQASDSEQEIRCAIKACDSKDAKGKAYPKKLDCTDLGTAKHSCVASKLAGKEPQIYSECPVVMTKPPQMVLSNTRVNAAGAAVPSNFGQAALLAGQNKVNFRRPDTIYRSADGKLKIIDAKFPCDGDPKWQPGQFEDYEKIAGRGNVKGVTPDDVADDECS